MDNNAKNVSYTVQVGVFRTEDAANRLVRPLKAIGYPVRIEKSGQYYVVLVGNFPILQEAVELEGDLKSLGYDTLVKEVEVSELNY